MANVNAVNLSVQAANNFTAAKSNTVVNANSTQSFGQYLGNSQASQNKTDAVSKQAADVKGVSDDKSLVGSRQDAITKTQNDIAKEATLDQSKTDYTVDSAKTDTVVQEIRDVVKDSLSIDDDTMDATLQMMGIVVTDLLNPNVLQQFVMALSGSQEATDFLTNEEMMSGFMELTQALDDFAQSHADDLTAMMEVLDTPVALDEILPDGELSDYQKIAQSQEVMQETADQPLEETITVTVTQDNASTQNAVAVAGKAEQTASLAADSNMTAADHVSEQKQTVEEPVLVQSVSEKAAGEETPDTGSDALEDASSDDLFFSQSSEAETPTEQMTTPLFAEQLGNVQPEAQLLQPELNTTQKMQQMVDIVKQVSEQIHRSINADTTTMEMQLNPERLGKVYFSVVSKAGVMTATFQVQSEEAKQALESQMITLKENLEAKNLKVESVDVQISDFSFEHSKESEGQEQGDFTKQEKRRFRYDADIADDSEESEQMISAEQMRRQVMVDNGGSIDYTA